MATERKGSNNSMGKKPWISIATIAGMIIVVVIALVYFWGGNGETTSLPSPGLSPVQSSSVQGIPVSAVRASSQQPGVLTYGVAPESIYEPTQVVIPVKGIFIKVSYRGGYEGSYTSGSETQEIHNSGERLFEIEHPGTSVSVSFKKQDNSAKQALVVEVWKDGSMIKTASTSLPSGEININGDI
ncbi:MAG: hypothetical protein WC593_10615 [Methanoregula sp.]